MKEVKQQQTAVLQPGRKVAEKIFWVFFGVWVADLRVVKGSGGGAFGRRDRDFLKSDAVIAGISGSVMVFAQPN